MLIYADCWLCWWLLSDKRGSLVNKIKWREERQTLSEDPPLQPPDGRSSVIKHWRYEAAFWRPKTWNSGGFFCSKWAGYVWRVSQEGAGGHWKWVIEFWPRDCWFFLMDLWWCGKKKKQQEKTRLNHNWSYILSLDRINFTCMKSFIIDLIILKSNSNSSDVSLDANQNSNCVIFVLGVEIFKFRLTDESLIGTLQPGIIRDSSQQVELRGWMLLQSGWLLPSGLQRIHPKSIQPLQPIRHQKHHHRFTASCFI